MWHTIKFVAQSRGLDVQALTAFASKQSGTCGVITSGALAEVSTWHVDQLVADFLASEAARRLSAAGGSDPHLACAPRRRGPDM